MLAIGLAAAPAARAETAADGACRFVDAATGDALQAFRGRQLSAAEAGERLRDLLDRYIDLPRLGQSSVGPHWQRAEAGQQSQFLEVFKRFLVAGYAGAVARIGDVRFAPASVVSAENDVTVVRTAMLPADGAPVPVQVTVDRGEAGDYRIVDVAAEGISLRRLLSADFTGFLRLNGGRIDALVGVLRDKIALAERRN